MFWNDKHIPVEIGLQQKVKSERIVKCWCLRPENGEDGGMGEFAFIESLKITSSIDALPSE